MASLEDCIPLSSDKRSFFHLKTTSPALENLSKSSIQRLMKLCLPIQLQHVYSKKKQELLFLLLNSLATSSYADYKDYILVSILQFLEGADFHDVIWINCCESGFLHRLLRKLFQILTKEKKETYVSFIIRKMILATKESPNEDQFEKRNRLLILQEFLHIIGTTTSVSWIEATQTLAEVGKNIVK